MSNANAASQPNDAHIPAQLTDAGNARIFAALNADTIRYSYTSRKWLIWTESRWVKDDTGEICRIAKNTLNKLWDHASAIPDDLRRRLIMRHALRSQGASRITAMITLAQSEPGIPVIDRDLDSDSWLLNVGNGTLDLKTGELLPHRREDLITKILPVAYEPAATCPSWGAFLDCVMAGDQQQIRFLQKAIGYSLTGSVSEQVIFILCGPGANGKSTLIAVIHLLLGDYGLSTPTETLLVKSGNGIPSDVARLKGARFVSAVESEHGRKLAEALVKQLTGGDKITARHLMASGSTSTPPSSSFSR
jgi:putative DNA primase/helicase